VGLPSAEEQIEVALNARKLAKNAGMASLMEMYQKGATAAMKDAEAAVQTNPGLSSMAALDQSDSGGLRHKRHSRPALQGVAEGGVESTGVAAGEGAKVGKDQEKGPKMTPMALGAAGGPVRKRRK
jgi:hypothetical protein